MLVGPYSNQGPFFSVHRTWNSDTDKLPGLFYWVAPLWDKYIFKLKLKYTNCINVYMYMLILGEAHQEGWNRGQVRHKVWCLTP